MGGRGSEWERGGGVWEVGGRGGEVGGEGRWVEERENKTK